MIEYASSNSSSSQNRVGLTKTLKSKDFFLSIHIQLDTVSKLNSESAGSKNPKHLKAVQRT